MRNLMIVVTLVYSGFASATSLYDFIPELKDTSPAIMKFKNKVQFGKIYSLNITQSTPQIASSEIPFTFYGELGEENCEGVIQVEEFNPVDGELRVSVLTLKNSKRSIMSVFGCYSNNDCIRISKGTNGSTTRPIITGGRAKNYLLSSFPSLILAIQSRSAANGCFAKFKVPSN